MSEAISGYGGKVIADGVDVDVTGFSFDYETNEVDVTTTADEGWEDVIGTTKKIAGSFDFFYTLTKRPFGTLGLIPGASPTLVLNCDTDIITGPALILKTTIKSATKEAITGTCDFRNKGPWTMPT